VSIRRRVLAALISLSLLLPTAAIVFTDIDEPPASTASTWMPDVAEGSAVIGNDGALESYFFEAKVTFPERPELPYVIIRSWYESPGKTRWEISSSVVRYPPRTLVAAGGDVFYYEVDTNTYFTSMDAYDDSIAEEPFPLVSSFQVGYTAGIFKIPSTTRPNRTEELLGRTLEVHGNEMPGSDGVWIDRALGFVVKIVQERDLNPSFVAEITRLAYNVPIDTRAFAFNAPPGALEVDPSSSKASTRSLTPDGFNPPPGFLAPSYLPSGYRPRGTGSGSAGGVTSEYRVTIKNEANGDVLELREHFRAGGPLPQQLQGDKIALKQGTGYISKSDGQTILAFSKGDILVYLQTSTLSVDELVRVAESMR